jgi:hypothetical protein
MQLAGSLHLDGLHEARNLLQTRVHKASSLLSPSSETAPLKLQYCTSSSSVFIRSSVLLLSLARKVVGASLLLHMNASPR